jgi:site-specific DNA recombinase
MIRAAIYARYSSDRQKDRSIEDQIAMLREIAARESMAVVTAFEDRQISGTGVINRPGFQAMMRAAEARVFDVILGEDMDRLFRNQADYHNAREKLDFLGIRIHTASDGHVTKLSGSLRALMGEVFIENLVVHTRRGMEGVIRDGRHAGGRAYGYRAVPGKAGELEIVEAEAEIVRRIFAEYIAGKSPRDIAHDLNNAAIAPPRGAGWNASTINGNMQRGHGLLLNEIYIGRIVWNKVRMIKDPATKKRISRPNPPDQWRVAEAPQLRIIGDDIWKAAQARKIANRPEPSGEHAPRPNKRRRMLTGLLRCGYCGSGMTAAGDKKGTARLQCSAFRESGRCTNGRKVKREDVERLALDRLSRELAEPVYLVEYVKAYNEERKRLARDAGNERGKLEKRKGEIDRELNRASEAIIKHGVDPAPLAPVINRLKAERDEIESKLASIETSKNVIALHPAALERYRKDVEELASLLPRPDLGDCDELGASVRRLVSAVVITAPANSEKLEIEIKGRLDELLSMPSPFSRRARGVDLLVAGEGLEPPTPGL